MAENTEYLALWGGRFTSGPSPELARLSKSHAVRLATRR